MDSIQLSGCKGSLCSNLVINGKNNVLAFCLGISLTLIAVNYAQMRIK